nr:mitochondrial translation release factor in rescue-like [Procambarus clarkii]
MWTLECVDMLYIIVRRVRWPIGLSEQLSVGGWRFLVSTITSDTPLPLIWKKIHKVVGFVVKCHEDRSLQRNRVKARQLMITKLDNHFNGEMSVDSQLRRIQELKNSKVHKKSLKREMMKKAWREREGID